MSTEGDDVKISVGRLIDSRMLVTVAGLCVTAGGGFAMLTAHGQDIDTQGERLEQVEESLTEHAYGNGHNLTGVKMGELERRIGQLETKVDEVKTRMAAQDASLAAICAATGARCP